MGSILKAGIALLVLAVISLNARVKAQEAPTQSELRAVLSMLPQNKDSPLFEVQLTNTGNRDLLLNLGYMAGNSRFQYAVAIHLILRNSKNDIETLELKGPPLVSGRVDQFIVPLPKGAHFVLPINLADYWNPAQRTSGFQLKPGTYFLSAEYRGESSTNPNLDMQGIRAKWYWYGKIASQEISFSVSKN